MGRTHALSGAVAFLAALPLFPHATAAEVTVATVCAAGAGVLPDLDHPAGTAARSFGPISHQMCRLVSRATGGHRHATHSLIGAAVFTAIAWAASADRWALAVLLWICMGFAARSLHHRKHPRDHVIGLINAAVCGGAAYLLALHVATHTTERTLVTLAVAIGVTAHIAGDLLTRQGCPLAWPHPRRYRLADITTDHWTEHWILTPTLLAAVVYLAALRAGVHLTPPLHHTAGRTTP